MSSPRLHAYCIRGADDPAPRSDVLGVGGAQVFTAGGGGLALWVSEVTGHGPTVAKLAEHERVVHEALRTATPLPLRFGTTFSDETAAIDALLGRAGEFRDLLDLVRDRVEMGLRVSTPGDAPASDASERIVSTTDATRGAGAGRSYLERRRTEVEAREAVMAEAEGVLEQLARELGDRDWPSARTVLSRGTLIGTVAHLVHRSAVRIYHQRVEEVRASRPDLRLDVTGPWAPYSFV